MSAVNFRDHRVYLVQLLRVLMEQGPVKPLLIYDDVANRVGITAEQRLVGADTPGQPVYRNRIQFARQSLIDAKLVISSEEPQWRRGIWELSIDGKNLANADRSDEELDRLIRKKAAIGAKARAEARKESRALAGLDGPSANDGVEESEDAQPELDATVEIGTRVEAENEAAFAAMLDHIRAMNDTAFEHLVGDVLKAALRADSVRITQKSRDGGVDGVLSFDALGMRTGVFEAKRYAEGNTVGRPLIDAFATAARRQRAAHALFVTSSSFSKEAVEAAKDEAMRLIDGNALVELMARHGIGLRAQQTFVVYEVDPAWGLEDDEGDV